MITQTLNINLVPGGVPPRINLNQYDKAYNGLIFNVYNGGQPFVFEAGMIASLEGRKADGNVFQYSTEIQNNQVVANIYAQMTVYPGEVICEVVIRDANGEQIGTGNFVINIEAAPLNNDAEISDSELPLIEEAVQIAPTIIATGQQVQEDAQNAADSASTAAQSATSAQGSASAASDSASAAAQSATSAQGSASAAADSASAAAQSEANAQGSAEDSEAWARGTRNGQAVPSTDETYHDNAKYWKDEAERIAQGISTGVVSFNGRTGQVTPQANDYAIGQIQATGTEGQVPKLINGVLTMADDTGGLLPHLIIISDAGSTVTVSKGSTVITPTQTGTDHWECDVPEFGTWTIDAILNGDDAQITVNIDTVKVYTIDDSHFHANVTVNYPQGATCRIYKGEVSYYASGTPYTFSLNSTGTWTVQVTYNGVTKTQNVNITTEGQSETVSVTFATITVQYVSDFVGQTITASNGTTTYTKTATNSLEVSFTIADHGTWSISAPADGTTYTESVNVSSDTTYTVNLVTSVVFAVHYSENDSSPASVSYPVGYDNSDFTDTFYVDLSSGAPHYGDWDPDGANANKLSWLYPKSCMLKYDGTVDYYLDENDETKKEDGVTASDVANINYAGNAMMEWGQNGKKIYWKIVPDSDAKGFTFVVANAKTDNDMMPWNHYDANGNVSDHFYTPKYFGSSDGTRLRSISGTTGNVSTTATQESTLARANNLNSSIIWDTENYADWLFVGLLTMLFAKSTDSQGKYGAGRCASSNTSAIANGTMNGKGMFYGKSNQTEGVKVFGMENPWGNLWRRIKGLINASGSVKVKLTHSTVDGTTASDYNETGSGYITHGTIGGDTTGGFISHMNITSKGITPNTMSGADNTYYTDGGWFNNSQTNFAIVGGYWHDALRVGAFCCTLYYAASRTGTGTGAAISCKPLAA